MGNVFKSVLASARAILQSKTVTAGTDPLTISPDSGYDGMSQVTINPTPTETATVTPTTSQQTVYPTSLDAHLSEVTVNPIPSEYVIPTSITPSNSSPVSMASGSAYKPSSAGYAISSYDTLTPSNTSPASVSSGGIYKASAGGYAISSYSSTSKSPSSTGTYFSSGWNRMTSSGYAYSSQPSGDGIWIGYGGRITSSSWTGVSDVIYNTISGASYSAPTLTLPSGKYKVITGVEWGGSSASNMSAQLVKGGSVYKSLPITTTYVLNFDTVEFTNPSTVSVQVKRTGGTNYAAALMIVIAM